MSKHYVGQPISIALTCSFDEGDISAATGAVIDYRKPQGTEGSWTGTLDIPQNLVTYEATGVDIDESGMWKLQPVITFADGRVIPGTTVDMPIAERFS